MKAYWHVFFTLVSIFLFSVAASDISANETNISKEQLFKPRVAVIPMVNIAKEKRYSAICSTVTDTIVLTLRLMGKYELVEAPDINPYRNDEVIGKYMKERDIDNAIFGRVYSGGNGVLVVEVSVYDRSSGEVRITRRGEADGLFDIFDVSDRLVSEVIGTFSGRHIGFGSMVFRNEGEDGEYRVYLDGEFVGVNIRGLNKVLNGEYECEVRQERMLCEWVIYRGKVMVYEGEETEVAFSIPYLLDEEKRYLNEIKEFIKKNEFKKEKYKETISKFANLERLFNDVSYSPRLKKEKINIKRWEIKYRLRALKWRIDDSLTMGYENPYLQREIRFLLEDIKYYDNIGLNLKKLKNLVLYYCVVQELKALDDFNHNRLSNCVYRYLTILETLDYFPLINADLLKEEARVVTSKYEEYIQKKLQLKNKNPNKKFNYRSNEIANYIKRGVTEDFLLKLSIARGFFNDYRKTRGNTLVVITYPLNMSLIIRKNISGEFFDRLNVNGGLFNSNRHENYKNKNVNRLPKITSILKLSNTKDKFKFVSPAIFETGYGEEYLILIRDPWFSYESHKVKISEKRCVVFLNPVFTGYFVKIGKYYHVRKKLNAFKAKRISNRKYRLEWDRLYNAKSYTVQVSTISDGFKHPDFEKSGIKNNWYHFNKNFEDGNLYIYRVCGVNENGLRTTWSFYAKFEGQMSWEKVGVFYNLNYAHVHDSVVFKDKIWVVGGLTTSSIWNTNDGSHWNLVKVHAPFGDRGGHRVVVFKNKIWVIGGRRIKPGKNGDALNDVWCSKDGINWELVTEYAGFSPRSKFLCTVFKDKIWVIGGFNETPINQIVYGDIWYSEDGKNWQRVKGQPFGTIFDSALIAFKNKMWLIGGQNKGVWVTKDGFHWKKVSASPQYRATEMFKCVTFNDMIYIIGGRMNRGYTMSYEDFLNDVFYTTDGRHWFKSYYTSSIFKPRGWFSCVVYKDKIWVIGGNIGRPFRSYLDVWCGKPE